MASTNTVGCSASASLTLTSVLQTTDTGSDDSVEVNRRIENVNDDKNGVFTDATEVSLGISEYLCGPDESLSGFSAVLKGRYSDFVVHEVGVDGSVARLTSLEPRVVTENDVVLENKDLAKVNESSPVKRQKLVETVIERADPVVITDPQAELVAVSETCTTIANWYKETDQKIPNLDLDWSTVESELAVLVGVEAATSAVSFLQNSNEEQKFFALPACNEKNARRNLHEWIRARLDHIAKADTVEKDNDKIVRLWHIRFEKKMPNYKSFASRDTNKRTNNGDTKRQQHKSSTPLPTEKYLQFVLYKENMDTGSALHQLSTCGRGSRNSRGRKNGSRANKLRLGYAGMKDKRGITCQFITAPAHSVRPHELIAVCNQWEGRFNKTNETGNNTAKNGASIMRVGNFHYVKDELRLGRLQGNHFNVALRNVRGTCDDQKALEVKINKAALAFKCSGFINYFGVQRFGKYHDTHKTGLAVLKGKYKEAIDIIMDPKPDERDQVTVARKEWQNRFSDLTPQSDAAVLEKSCASRVVKQFGRFMNSEVAVLSSLEHHPLDYQRAYMCISKTMRMMFLHSVQSYLWNHVASFRLAKMPRVVLVGDLVYIEPKNDMDDLDLTKEVKIVTKEDVTASRFTLSSIVLPLLGTKTIDPENESGRQYNVLLNELGLDRTMFSTSLDRDFDCTGDYRRLICHPTDVDFELVTYHDPRQPLLQTDWMKLNNVLVSLGYNTLVDDNSPVKHNNDLLLAMNVGFTLPSSSYATIAIRELMKRPTSSDYQSELKLE